jgi:hypothetical protein
MKNAGVQNVGSGRQKTEDRSQGEHRLTDGSVNRTAANDSLFDFDADQLGN